MVFVEAIAVGCFPNYTLVHGNWTIFTRALLLCIKIMFKKKAFFSETASLRQSLVSVHTQNYKVTHCFNSKRVIKLHENTARSTAIVGISFKNA